MRCPVCQTEFNLDQSPAKPFCSQRCRSIDLGRWLDERYSLPKIPDPDEEGESVSEVAPESAARAEEEEAK